MLNIQTIAMYVVAGRQTNPQKIANLRGQSEYAQQHGLRLAVVYPDRVDTFLGVCSQKGLRTIQVEWIDGVPGTNPWIFKPVVPLGPYDVVFWDPMKGTLKFG